MKKEAHVYMSIDIFKALSASASHNHRSVNAEILVAIENYLKFESSSPKVYERHFRQVRIADMRAAGWSYREIGKEMGLSHETVRQIHEGK